MPYRMSYTSVFVVTVFLCDRLATLASRAIGKIDRSIAIAIEDAQNKNRANFSLKSKAEKLDGLTVGFRPSAENFAYKNQCVTMH